jgi:pimeloyl-ACP methyl ester carboxylesterase
MNTALEVMKARYGAKSLVLVGYSGGGAVAAILAAYRKDVERLVTVAGNLDHRAWTQHHAVSPLVASLDARDLIPDLRGLQQVHIAGSRDRIIPVAIVQRFAERIGPNARLVVREDADHHCCWVDDWPRLWPQVGPTANDKP